MRVDRVIRDMMRTLHQIVQALDNNVTVQDNFGGSGAESGSILTSIGRNQKPIWQSGEDFVAAHPELKGDKGDKGDAGDSSGGGSTTVDCDSCVESILSQIVCSAGDVVTSNGEVVWSG